MNRARNQAAAVSSLKGAYGRIMYDYQVEPNGSFDPSANSAIPKWLLDRLGIDVFHSVSWLDLDSPVVQNKDLEALRALPNVQVLFISNTSITDEGLSELAHLRQLRWLVLNTANLSDKATEHLGKLRTLRVLEIQEAEITDNGLEKLYALRGLERLVFDQTHVTEVGIEKLREELPGCEIDVWD